VRKIVHIDMDAFYASVEQRDDPALRGRPVVVAWRGARSVVCAASYEARRFGVRSAMPALRAEKLCPQAVFVPPDFARYKAVSQQIRAIFGQHAERVEPLSLDEAYLDVSRPKSDLPSATAIAERIRAEIRETTALTASAGIAGNKFLAKIASDWRKPDGQFVIRPEHAIDFLTPLPVGKLPGVGPVMQARLAELGIETVGELRARPEGELQARFGRWGARLVELAHGIDESPVSSERLVQSVSSEDTFAQDLALDQLDEAITALAERTWQAQSRLDRVGRSVVLKLKTSDFRLLTRSYTPPAPPASQAEFSELALGLRARVELPDSTRYRLVGVGLGNFCDRDTLQAQRGLW
jgi:DNA polymerase IV